MVCDLHVYLFDLRGFLNLERALEPWEVEELNTGLDSIPPPVLGQWHDGVHAHDYGDSTGINLQQIYEAGEPFERLIDHPA